jgi:AmmeMemoRadiSam system protein B
MNVAQARPPAVAGQFYPADGDELRRCVERHLASGRRLLAERGDPVGPGMPLRALVVPHAGYIYSGPVAGVAYALLAQHAAGVHRVWVLGPAHYVSVRGGALSSAEFFTTPLGPVPVDGAAADMSRHCPWVVVDDAAHAPEHSLEVQLPFLQQTLPGVDVVPLVVGSCDAERVGRFLAGVMDEPGTLVVVSTDLSHYLDQETARQRDTRTAAHLLRREWRAISDRDACGVWPLRALVAAAQQRRMSVDLLDLRTSGDTRGNRDRVVGYGAFALTGGSRRP